jgi:prepilin-type processing-associated H-X9-DG protein
MSNLKQIGLGLMMYVQDYDETYPAQSMGYSVNGDPQRWVDVLQPYAKSYQVWVCPTSGPVYSSSGGRMFSYAMNNGGATYNLTTNVGHGFGNLPTGAGTPNGPDGGPLKLASVQNTSQVIFAGDPSSNGKSSEVGVLEAYSADSFIPVLHGGQVGPFYGYTSGQPVDMSQGGGNYLFADGHVKFIQAQRLVPRTNRIPYFDVQVN